MKALARVPNIKPITIPNIDLSAFAKAQANVLAVFPEIQKRFAAQLQPLADFQRQLERISLPTQAAIQQMAEVAKRIEALIPRPSPEQIRVFEQLARTDRRKRALDRLGVLPHESILAPPFTILVLNEATVPAHRTAHAAFESAVRTHAILTNTIQRGAVVVRMPRLEPAAEVDRARLTFAAAEEGRFRAGEQIIGPWKRQQIAIWRRAMEESFAPVATWLP